jgi:hypothetical protein
MSALLNDDIEKQRMPYLTIFTAPKPFTNPHIALIQRNAIRSWMALGDPVEVLLIGEEDGLADTAQELGVRHLAEVERNANGTPLIHSIFDLARQNGSGELLAYVNADILLLQDFVTAARLVHQSAQKFLIVGQRWDLDVRTEIDFSSGWDNRLREWINNEGNLHSAGGSDYFIFPRVCLTEIPEMAVGRAGWDNWMIYAGRRDGLCVVDATKAIQIVHQNHDYAHLPNGQPHYRLPETAENIRLGGGKLTIFKLADANYRLGKDRLKRQPITWSRFWREVEIFPLIRLKSFGLTLFLNGLLHPFPIIARLYRAIMLRMQRFFNQPGIE